MVRRAALAHPGLRITLRRDGRQSHEYLPAASLQERASAVLGVQLNPVSGQRSGVSVHAMLAAPEKARAGAGGLHMFVNGRPVKDRALARAVAFAYGSVLPPGRYPVGVVHVSVPPEELDVNVHPRKTEVRFARAREVMDAITRVLADGLGTTAWGAHRSGPATRAKNYWAERFKPQLASTPGDPAFGDPASLENAGPSTDPWGLTGSTPTPYAPPTSGPVPYVNDGPLLAEEGFFASLRVLGQVRRMLIVCEGKDALHVIDQHAADERVRFDRLRQTYRAREVATQRLLIPERVEVTEAEAVLCEERREQLLALGLDVVPIGTSTVAVHAVPALVDRASAERLLQDVLAEMTRSGERAFGDAVDMALATMACHGAIRAGDPLSPDECRALLRSLDAVSDFGGHCPHGRPVAQSIPFSDLERQLGR